MLESTRGGTNPYTLSTLRNQPQPRRPSFVPALDLELLEDYLEQQRLYALALQNETGDSDLENEEEGEEEVGNEGTNKFLEDGNKIKPELQAKSN